MARGNRTYKSKHTGHGSKGTGAISKHAQGLPSTKGLSKKAKKVAANAAAWALVETCDVKSKQKKPSKKH